ncbi:MAG: YjfB family protein [Defluviitaleaceae bacterium]|nr:YjfB family protein [Defluviitaleaceae bacterium]
MDVMGIANLSMSMANQNVMQEVGIAVLRNAMDHAEQTGEFMADMLVASAVPPVGFDGLGINIDIMM